MEIPVYARYQWWIKWYGIVVITDEGVFAEGEVPEDYGGPQLTTEVIQRVIFATDSGYMWEWRYDDTTGLMDRERKKGVGANLEAVDGVQEAETLLGAGPSTHTTSWYARENPIFSPDRQKLVAIVQKVLSNFL